LITDAQDSIDHASQMYFHPEKIYTLSSQQDNFHRLSPNSGQDNAF